MSQQPDCISTTIAKLLAAFRKLLEFWSVAAGYRAQP